MPTSYSNTRAFSNIAHQHDAGDAFAALPVHILITHVLSSGILPDPSDLARLRAVSREMRDAVAATGREVYELGAESAIYFGDLGGLQLMHQRGDLVDDFKSLCTWAEEEGTRNTEVVARERLPLGRVDMLDCGVSLSPRGAALVARERLPVEREGVRDGGKGRAPRGAAVGACEWLPVGLGDVRVRGGGRASRGASVGARERLPVEQECVLICGAGWETRGAAMGARERMPVGRGDVHVCGEWWAPRGTAMVACERLPVEPSDVRVRGAGRALQVVILGSRERRTRSLRRRHCRNNR